MSRAPDRARPDETVSLGALRSLGRKATTVGAGCAGHGSRVGGAERVDPWGGYPVQGSTSLNAEASR